MNNEKSARHAHSTHKGAEPIFHPQMRRTREVIRRPEWVKRTGEGVAHRGSLGLLGVFGILFANCVGGGYGFEDGIGSAGPLITLTVCLALPWVWSFPTGLAIAELSTAVPSNSGVLMWTNAAFPPFVSFLCILMTIFITFTSNATYPGLTAEYVQQLTPINKGAAAGVKIAVVIICCVLNCVGVEIVGSASIIMCAVTILPFMLLTLIQLFGHGFNKAVLKVGVDDRGVEGVNWGAFFSIISWNYANIENAGAVVEEVANPRKTLPKAMMLLMFGTYVGYVLPMLAGVSNQGVGQDYTQWQAGHWPVIADAVAGPWLKYMLFSGAMLSGVGFTLTNMCCTSRLLAGMGTMQMFPKKVSRVIGYYHPRLGTPIPAILINSAVTMIFSCTLDFTDIVSLSQSLYCMRMLVIYAAVVKLRIQYPRLPRPYALPFNTWMCALFLTPAAAFSLMAAIVSAMTSLAIGMAFLGFMVGGCAVSWLYCRIFAKNGFQGVIVLCEISDDDVDDAHGGTGDGVANNDDEDKGVLDEGVFYHDGEDDPPGDLLLGILPMSNDAAAVLSSTLSRSQQQQQPISTLLGALGPAAGSGSGGGPIGVNVGDSGGSSSTSGEDVGGAEYMAREELPNEGLPGLRRRPGRSGGVLGGVAGGGSDDDMDMPMYPLKETSTAGTGNANANNSIAAAAASGFQKRRTSSGGRATRARTRHIECAATGGGAGFSDDDNSEIGSSSSSSSSSSSNVESNEVVVPIERGPVDIPPVRRKHANKQTGTRKRNNSGLNRSALRGVRGGASDEAVGGTGPAHRRGDSAVSEEDP